MDDNELKDEFEHADEERELFSKNIEVSSWFSSMKTN